MPIEQALGTNVCMSRLTLDVRMKRVKVVSPNCKYEHLFSTFLSNFDLQGDKVVVISLPLHKFSELTSLQIFNSSFFLAGGSGAPLKSET